MHARHSEYLAAGIADVTIANERWKWTLEERIASDTSEGCRVLQELLKQLAKNDWSDRDTFGVHLAVEEALVNAIRHGNQNDPEKTVFVFFGVEAEFVQIVIEDQGDGFDPASVPDPTAEENLESPSGRGLMLMRSFMTSVVFNDRGNRVSMMKSPSTGEPAVDEDEDD